MAPLEVIVQGEKGSVAHFMKELICYGKAEVK